VIATSTDVMSGVWPVGSRTPFEFTASYRPSAKDIALGTDRHVVANVDAVHASPAMAAPAASPVRRRPDRHRSRVGCPAPHSPLSPARKRSATMSRAASGLEGPITRRPRVNAVVAATGDAAESSIRPAGAALGAECRGPAERPPVRRSTTRRRRCVPARARWQDGDRGDGTWRPGPVNASASMPKFDRRSAPRREAAFVVVHRRHCAGRGTNDAPEMTIPRLNRPVRSGCDA